MPTQLQIPVVVELHGSCWTMFAVHTTACQTMSRKAAAPVPDLAVFPMRPFACREQCVRCIHCLHPLNTLY
jgi:hypothetical protein